MNKIKTKKVIFLCPNLPPKLSICHYVRANIMVTFVTVAGGALDGGGGRLQQLHGAPQQGAAGVRAAATRAAWLRDRIHHRLRDCVGFTTMYHWQRASGFSTLHHCPLVLLVDGGALAEEGREQEDQEGGHRSAAVEVARNLRC